MTLNELIEELNKYKNHEFAKLRIENQFEEELEIIDISYSHDELKIILKDRS